MQKAWQKAYNSLFRSALNNDQYDRCRYKHAARNVEDGGTDAAGAGEVINLGVDDIDGNGSVADLGYLEVGNSVVGIGIEGRGEIDQRVLRGGVPVLRSVVVDVGQDLRSDGEFDVMSQYLEAGRSVFLAESILALVQAAYGEHAVLVGADELSVSLVLYPVGTGCGAGGVVLALRVEEVELCAFEGLGSGVILVYVKLVGEYDDLVSGGLAVRGGSVGVVGILEVNFVGVAVEADYRAVIEGRVVVDDQNAVDGELGNRLEDVVASDGKLCLACFSADAVVDIKRVGYILYVAVFAALYIVERDNGCSLVSVGVGQTLGEGIVESIVVGS